MCSKFTYFCFRTEFMQAGRYVAWLYDGVTIEIFILNFYIIRGIDASSW